MLRPVPGTWEVDLKVFDVAKPKTSDSDIMKSQARPFSQHLERH